VGNLITQHLGKFTFPEAVLKPSCQNYNHNFDLKISFWEDLLCNKMGGQLSSFFSVVGIQPAMVPAAIRMTNDK
jgi:hypothetical protein